MSEKCTFVQISNILKVCVQNVLYVLECKLKDVDATAWPLHRWTSVGNVPTLDQVRLQRVTSQSGCGIHTLMQLTPNLVVHQVEVRTFSWPQSWSDEVWCRVNSCMVSHWLRQHNVTSIRVTAVPYITLYWKLRYFVIDIWRLVTPQSNNIF